MGITRIAASAACALATLTVALPAAAQDRAGVMGELLQDVRAVEQKMLSLAEAIPAEKFGWRPAEGVRSVGEVVMHVAADNFYLTMPAGVMPPASTGLKLNDYPSIQAYEGREMDKAGAIAEMRASFEHLRKAMMDTPDTRLEEKVDLFGGTPTVRGLWILTTTHLHEHLGQMIAYARSNGVTPPWSGGGN